MLQEHFTYYMQIRAGSVGAILGKQGKVSQGIKARTGASLSLALDGTANDVRCDLSIPGLDERRPMQADIRSS